jgi:hypothetical protein
MEFSVFGDANLVNFCGLKLADSGKKASGCVKNHENSLYIVNGSILLNIFLLFLSGNFTDSEYIPARI